LPWEQDLSWKKKIKNKRGELSMDRKLVAVCGLFCGACTVYIGSHEEPARLEKLAVRMGTTPDKLYCNGCGSDRRSGHCLECAFIACAKKKKIEFCGACAEFPCAELMAFQEKMPHRAELFGDQKIINENGWQKWYVRAVSRNSCPVCGAINSAYDAKCRKCGRTPASFFNADNEKEISRYNKKISGK
jgi:hypothetical protein